MLPFDNPLRTAEDYAMVDVLSGGRLDLGVGSGYLTHEYAGFDLDPEEKRARFDEALEILLRAWTGERFSYEGRYHQVRDVRLNVRPRAAAAPAGVGGHPPHRRAAPASAPAGFPVMLIPYASAETLPEMAAGLAAYRAAFVAAGGRPEDATVPFGLHLLLRGEHRAGAGRGPRAPWSATCARGSTRCSGRSRPSSSRTWSRSAIPRRSSAWPASTRRPASRISSPSPTSAACPHKQVLRSMELMARHVLPRFGGRS